MTTTAPTLFAVTVTVTLLSPTVTFYFEKPRIVTPLILRLALVL